MGSAKYKKNKNDPSFIVPDDTSNLKQNILDEDGDERDDDSDDGMESRPDLTDSSGDDQFSRDSNYVLEEYHLYDELETIIEKNEEKQRQVMDLPTSEHGFDTYNLTNFKEIKLPIVVKIDLVDSPQ